MTQNRHHDRRGAGPDRSPLAETLETARVDRVNREIAEIKGAARLIRDHDDAFYQQVADFLDREAATLERNNVACTMVDLPADQDTRQHVGYSASGAASALLIARAYAARTVGLV